MVSRRLAPRREGGVEVTGNGKLTAHEPCSKPLLVDDWFEDHTTQYIGDDFISSMMEGERDFEHCSHKVLVMTW